MRKLLLALPLVAGASWAGTTYYSGAQTQPAYDKLLSQLNQLKPLQFVSEEYDAGFIKSTAVTKVLFEGAPDDEPLFRLKHVIEHSPVGVDNAGARVGANSVITTLMIEEMNPELELALNGREPMVLHTRVDISGSTSNDFQLAEFTLTDDDENVEFGGGSFSFVSEPSGRIYGKGSTKQLKVTKSTNGGVIELAESPLAVDMQYHADGIYSGTMSWDSPSMVINDPSSGMNLSFKQLNISSDTKVSNDRLDSGFKMSVAQLEAPIPVTSFNWGLSMNGLALEGLKRFEKIRSQITVPGAVNEQNNSEFAGEVVAAYKAMFAPGTGFKTDLNVSNKGGDMALKMNLDFRGDGSASGTDNMQTVRDLMMALTLGATLDADASAVDMTPLAMFMDHPLASQYIMNDGVKYTTDLKLEDILLYANGETQNVVAMFGLGDMLDMPLDFLGSF